jgi:hypothetical protein
VEQAASRGCRTKKEYQQGVACILKTDGLRGEATTTFTLVCRPPNLGKCVECSLLSKAGRKRRRNLKTKEVKKSQTLATFAPAFF